MFRTVVACALVLTFAAGGRAQTPDSELKTIWKEVTSEHDGEWGYGFLHERRGQICDVYRQWNQESPLPEDKWPGCTVLFIADPDDEWDLGTVAAGEQDNFLNTQHYKSSWTLHGSGFLGNSLPRAPKDLDPVCLFAKVDDRMVLGYEEGEGDKFLPCPGHRTGAPFDEDLVMAAMNDTALAEDMCTQCYQSVCTGDGATKARDCGSSGDGGKDLEDTAIFAQQADPVYHCHLTMADEGACDYVQYVQHESARTYYMDYSVTCGWQNIQYLNITFCDCTKVAGANNGCRRKEAMDMAYVGVVCGNCNGAGFSEDRAFESIFSPANEEDEFDGTCALYRTLAAKDDPNNWSEATRKARMMCSKGIWCPNGFNGGDNCEFHCDHYGRDSEWYFDVECGDYPDFPTEICTDTKCFYLPKDEKKSWEDAKEFCEEAGGNLASITSAAEEEIVYRLSVKAGRNDLWIGLTDIANEDDFVWDDGSEFEFENWDEGQPNDPQNPNKASQDCTRWFQDGWQDKNCEDSSKHFVCSGGEAFTGFTGTERRLLTTTARGAITLETRFDRGHIVGDVRASGYRPGKAAAV